MDPAETILTSLIPAHPCCQGSDSQLLEQLFCERGRLEGGRYAAIDHAVFGDQQSTGVFLPLWLGTRSILLRGFSFDTVVYSKVPKNTEPPSRFHQGLLAS